MEECAEREMAFGELDEPKGPDAGERQQQGGVAIETLCRDRTPGTPEKAAGEIPQQREPKGGRERTEEHGRMLGAGRVGEPEGGKVGEDGDRDGEREGPQRPAEGHRIGRIRPRNARFPALGKVRPSRPGAARDPACQFEHTPPLVFVKIGAALDGPQLPANMRPMRSSTRARMPNESSDDVGMVIALLVRFPEIATIVSHPGDGTLTLSFAVAEHVTRGAERLLRERLTEHVRALGDHTGEHHDVLTVECESDRSASFLRITRDVRTFTREELQLLVALLADRFGAALHRSLCEDDASDEETSSDQLVDFAIEALRDPESQRSLVGFREEQRVLVYFVKSRKKAKARARS